MPARRPAWLLLALLAAAAAPALAGQATGVAPAPQAPPAAAAAASPPATPASATTPVAPVATTTPATPAATTTPATPAATTTPATPAAATTPVAPAAAASSVPAAPLQPGAVMQDPNWLPYRAMRRGLAAFERYHVLAPDAEARFVLRPQTPDSTTAGLMLRIVAGDSAILVPVMADGSFSLPPGLTHADDNAELELNRKKDLFRWRPWIQSPDLPRGTRRLGDLRLECQVLWALEQSVTPTAATTAAAATAAGAPGPATIAAVAASAAGPCQSAALVLGFPAPAPLASATLQAGGRSLALRLSGKGQLYFPPLADSSWPDDALIVFKEAPR